MYQQAIRLIEQYNTIIIHRHNNPDGDALGSQIGLKHIIACNYPDKTVYMVGDGAQRYSFMEDSIMDNIDDDVWSNALAIILDTSASKLISDNRYLLASDTLRIDHHIFCEHIAKAEIVDTSFESCCGLIAHMAMQCQLSLPPLACKSLYTGMVTDSGRFRYDSTTARTFAIAGKLLQDSLDITDIYRNLYSEDYKSMQLRASYVLKVQFSDCNVAYIYTTHSELLASGADVFTISRGMVGVMSDIKGVDIWVNFTETGNEVLCELRSSRYNINPIAVKYGGGGHAKASGATVKSKQEAMAMLIDLNNLMEQQ